jgi:hypothetical protein
LDDAAHRGPVALQQWWSAISTRHRLHMAMRIRSRAEAEEGARTMSPSWRSSEGGQPWVAEPAPAK